jgi:hypothetical protein
MVRKAISFILTFYVIVLLTQPCQDVFALPREADSQTNVVALTDEPDDSDCEDENCSPFCICSCCSLSVIHCTFTNAVTLEATSNPDADGVIRYTNPYSNAYQSSIWQPPKK